MFYLFTFLQFLVAFTITIPLLLYVVGPILNFLLHGTPIATSQAKALSFEKMCYFILFASAWTSAILWLQKFIPWYRTTHKNQNAE